MIIPYMMYHRCIQIGRLLDELQSLQLRESTVVAVIGDHHEPHIIYLCYWQIQSIYLSVLTHRLGSC